MAATSGAFPFPKLVKDNYERWSIQMKTFLGGQDVWKAIEEEYVEPKNLAGSSQAMKKTAKEARLKDQKALSLIQLGVDDNMFLEDYTGHHCEESMGFIGECFQGHRQVEKVMNQLEKNSEEMEDSRVVEKILRSLDPKFDHVVVVIEESDNTETITVDELSGKLQVHVDKIKRRNKEPVEQAL
ncbi:hypothetical protein RJ640_003871 [Escallonia rubra]|uniref:DUF4219 domain-containing protein n=1 Tax=Escallonia rubra TaxID=112253 RepID=A0AA88R9F9_9ASTE|nr:hypothetical protein RJ640_003871 [Escallonia rubra]